MRRWAPLALYLLVLAAGGCGTGNPAPTNTTPATTAPGAGSTMTDYTTADALYRQMMPGLNLPPGVTFPAHLPESGGGYQANAGLVTAQNFWLCSWLWRYLDTASGARADAQAAVKNLVLYNRMDAYTKGLDAHGQQAVDNAVKAAQSGDRQTVTSFTQSTCAGPFFGQSHATRH